MPMKIPLSKKLEQNDFSFRSIFLFISFPLQLISMIVLYLCLYCNTMNQHAFELIQEC